MKMDDVRVGLYYKKQKIAHVLIAFLLALLLIFMPILVSYFIKIQYFSLFILVAGVLFIINLFYFFFNKAGKNMYLRTRKSIITSICFFLVLILAIAVSNILLMV